MHLEMRVSSRVKWSVVLSDRNNTRMGLVIHPTFLEYPHFQEKIRSAILQLLEA